MADEYTRVVFGTLEQAQADFVQSYNSLQETVSTLDSQLLQHLAEWDALSKQAYHKAKATWDAALADMANVLKQLGLVIGTANDNYIAAEAANTAAWGG